MKHTITILFLLASTVFAQTRSIVPYADGLGSIGRTNKAWSAGYFNDLIVNGTNLNTRISSNNVFTFNALTGSVELVAGDGVQIVTNGNQLTIQLQQAPFEDGVGTNRVYFQYTGYTNYWTVPEGVSNIAVWAWGGGAASFIGSAYAGFSYGVANVEPGSVLAIVVGQGGQGVGGAGITNFSYTRPSFGGGGRGWVGSISANAYGVSGGGGFSGIFSDTNVLIIAGGAGGAATGTSGGGVAAGNGGGLSGGDGGGTTGGGGGTQLSGGAIVSLPSLIGTNTPGTFLQGGDGGGDADGGSGGGGGGGYYGGGGGAGQTTSIVGAGGGGSGYINESYFIFGVTLRGLNTSTIGTDQKEYLSGVGQRALLNKIFSDAGNGLIVIGY